MSKKPTLFKRPKGRIKWEGRTVKKDGDGYFQLKHPTSGRTISFESVKKCTQAGWVKVK
jgi:hypothetical protein